MADAPSKIDNLLTQGEPDQANRSRHRAHDLLGDFRTALAIDLKVRDPWLDRVMEDFLAECVLGAAWYQANCQKARRKVRIYIVLNFLLVVLLPVGLILLGKFSAWLDPQGMTAQVTGQITGVLTGILGLQKTLSTWYASQQRYAVWYKSASDLKSIYFGLLRKWTDRAQANRNAFLADLRDGTIAARGVIDAEQLDYYQKLALPTFDILDILTAGRSAASSFVTSLLPGTPPATVTLVGRTALANAPQSSAAAQTDTTTPDTQSLVFTPGGPRPRAAILCITSAGPAAGAPGSFDPTLAKSSTQRANWIAYAQWTNTGAPIKSFVTSWTVPPAPTTPAGQTIYLFNGIETQDFAMILQPVLQWGTFDADPGTGPYWSVASWLVKNFEGLAYHSMHTRVEPNTRLTGIITLLERDQSGNCTYRCEFAGIQDSVLNTADALSGTMPELVWCNQVLEVYEHDKLDRTAYDLNSKDEYPNTGSVVFDNIGVQKTDGSKGELDWQPANRPRYPNLGGNCIPTGSGKDAKVQIYFYS